MIDIITYAVIIFAGLLAALLIAYPLRFLWKPVFTVILSTVVLIITNLIGYPFDFRVGINPLTILFVSLLGVPGYTTLILICLLL